MRAGRGWAGRLREVGDAFLGVMRAEVAALADDLTASGRALVRALLVVAAAFGVAFWTLGLLLYFAVELIALVLPRWGAVGSVLAFFVLLSVVLGLVARRRFAGFESPAAIARRRLDDHRAWWQERVAQSDEPALPPEGEETP